MAALTTRRVMLTVLAALTPGIAALCWFIGPGYLPRLLFAAALGLAVELVALRLRRRPPGPTLSDGSTLLTCVLVTIALPPDTAPGVLAIAVVAAVAIGKHVYGGLGANPFNPAVVGYAVVLVSFPAELARWPTATDGLTGATALTALRHREGQTVAEAFATDPAFGAFGGSGWDWVNLAFLAGGVALMAMRLAAWRVPLAVLGSLGLAAALGYDSGSSRSLGSPLFHWLSGGTCLAACFFATDPVTHPVTARGQILFGCLVGIMAFVIRGFGNYPDGIAFGILLGNAVTPYLDRRLTREAAHD